METTNQKLVSWLFETKAVRVCPQNNPFWYTSGTIGPYYINTHFLYGSEGKANALLELIDAEKSDIYGCPERVLEETRKNCEKDAIFKGLMDEMCRFIKENICLEEVDYISGGERRDWFFSLLAAEILGKPHITIYKDLKAVVSLQSHGTTELEELKGANVLHIADLITEASSYERAWIPAIKEHGGNIRWSVVVVDRKQGGEQLLMQYGVKSLSMVNIDPSLFDDALSMNLINGEQHGMLMSYFQNPKESMRNFLIQHPEFLKNALNSDAKAAERARLCLEKDFYGIKGLL